MAQAQNAHVAFAAPDRATVNAFHAAALEAGGSDDREPGLRENCTKQDSAHAGLSLRR